MDLDDEELKETKKKIRKKKFYNKDYQDLKKLKKLYDVKYDYEIYKRGD